MSPNEYYLLKIAEEATEVSAEASRVAQSVMKLMTFGADSIEPTTFHQEARTNAQRLFEEMNDLMASWEKMTQMLEWPSSFDIISIEQKKAKIDKYLRVAQDLNCVSR